MKNEVISNSVSELLNLYFDFTDKNVKLNDHYISRSNGNTKIKLEDAFFNKYNDSMDFYKKFDLFAEVENYINNHLDELLIESYEYVVMKLSRVIELKIKNILLNTVSVKDTLKKNKLNTTIKNQKRLIFSYKNILFKGVPGTGKSHKIDKIITDILNLDKNSDNVLRVNIHSASSNADLMQGIAISTENDQVSYKEKQGLIFKHIQKACFSPYEPFVLVLEEIQENSLNELIGDLIYLIEPSKRAKITKDLKSEIFIDKKEYEYDELVNLYIEHVEDVHSVELPNLVSINEENRKMIMPDNLYIFCTSNYRDDKKVIEDNLLRRFDVIEVYPQYKDTIGDDFKSQEVSDFLEELNESILKIFENHEIHPDRFLIGHSNWIDIKDDDKSEFYKALLKVVIEFKEIREIEFKEGIKKIFKSIELDNSWVKESFDKINIENGSYKIVVSSLQNLVYQQILELN